MVRRAEIQGLRAIAVLLVLLFHAGWLRGGYVGVDVFYVISGYLITSLIVNDEQFSFAKFYARRAKRLLPAAFVVLAATAVAFWLLAPSGARSQFSKDLAASTWYVSNYLYAHWQNDYQNLGATPSPLIHYWSLAVEEQFYLFWPLLLVAFKRVRRPAVFLITAASFMLSITLVKSAPIFAFYSLPTRAFELGLGAILALSTLRLKMVWPGLILIALSALLFDSKTPFPALPALLPIFGAFFVLASPGQQILLSNRWLQKIGDWSYSIYLWHWPMLVLPAIYLQRELGNKEKLAILILCVAVSRLTYKYLENPIRRREFKNKSILVSALVCGIVLSGSAFALNRSAEASQYSLEKPSIYANGCHQGYSGSHIKRDCIFGDKRSKRSIVLLGDSHAAQWFPALENWATNRNFKLYTFTKSSCPALQIPLQDNGGFKAADCNNFRTEALMEISKINPELVILGNFEHYKVDPKYYSSADSYSFKHLLIRDTPWPNRDIPICLTGKDSCATKLPNRITYKSKNIFDPVPLLCSDKCPAIVDGLLAYRDQTHITVAMAEHLGSALGRKLDSLVAR